METITLNEDIKVMYITAKTFPDGIKEAHEKLHTLIPFSTHRKYFGISRPENGTGEITYRAAAQELLEGEAEKLNIPTMLVEKGEYAATTIHEYMKDMKSISETFQVLLKLPDLDPLGYCVEWYINEKDVKCMVRIVKKNKAATSTQPQDIG